MWGVSYMPLRASNELFNLGTSGPLLSKRISDPNIQNTLKKHTHSNMHVRLFSFVLDYTPYYPLLQNKLWVIGSYSNIRCRLNNAVYHFFPLHIDSTVMSAATSTTIPSIAVASESTAVAVVTTLVEADAGFLDSILDQLCALSDEAAVKEGKAEGNSFFKLSTLK